MESTNKVLSPVDRWVGTFEKDVIMPIENTARRIPFVAQPILGIAQIVASVALIIIFSVVGSVTCSKNCWDIVFHAGRHLGHGCVNLSTIVSDLLIFGLTNRIPFTVSENPWVEGASYIPCEVHYDYALHLIEEERDTDQEIRKALTEMQNDLNYQWLKNNRQRVIEAMKTHTPAIGDQIMKLTNFLVHTIEETDIETIDLKDYQRVSQQIKNKSFITYFNTEGGYSDYGREVKVEELILYVKREYEKQIKN